MVEKKKRGGANKPSDQPYRPSVSEVLEDIRIIGIHDHLHTVQREFLELAQADRLENTNYLNTLDFLGQLHQDEILYGSVVYNNQYYFMKYKIILIEPKIVDNVVYTFVSMANIQYTFHPETGAPIVTPFYPNFGKFLICNMEDRKAQLYEKINDQFYPRNEELLFTVRPAPGL